MKKIIKLVFVVAIVLAFSLNVSINFNDNKVKLDNLTTSTKIAVAFDHCELELDNWTCYCESHDYYCAGYTCSEIYVRRCYSAE